MTDDQWNTVLDVTLTATFRLTGPSCGPWLPPPPRRHRPTTVRSRLAAQPAMRPTRGEGRGPCADPLRGHGVAQYGIRINDAVSPSIVMHPFLATVTTEDNWPELLPAAFRPRRRALEFANVMVLPPSYLLSYMTGEVCR